MYSEFEENLTVLIRQNRCSGTDNHYHKEIQCHENALCDRLGLADNSQWGADQSLLQKFINQYVQAMDKADELCCISNNESSETNTDSLILVGYKMKYEIWVDIL